MRAFICIGVAIIATFIFISVGLETGFLDCNGQPCIIHKDTTHDPD